MFAAAFLRPIYTRFGIAILIALCLNTIAKAIAIIESKYLSGI
jgi:hypothetical protein